MRARVVVIPEENGEFLLFSFGRIVLVLNFLLRILNMKWPKTTYKYTFFWLPTSSVWAKKRLYILCLLDTQNRRKMSPRKKTQQKKTNFCQLKHKFSHICVKYVSSTCNFFSNQTRLYCSRYIVQVTRIMRGLFYS